MTARLHRVPPPMGDPPAPPATADDLEESEERLGFVLPQAVRELYELANGGAGFLGLVNGVVDDLESNAVDLYESFMEPEGRSRSTNALAVAGWRASHPLLGLQHLLVRRLHRRGRFDDRARRVRLGAGRKAIRAVARRLGQRPRHRACRPSPTRPERRSGAHVTADESARPIRPAISAAGITSTPSVDPATQQQGAVLAGGNRCVGHLSASGTSGIRPWRSTHSVRPPTTSRRISQIDITGPGPSTSS